jgi:sugar phosphate isomerase/epimerase
MGIMILPQLVCQTITFGEGQRTRFPELFEAVSRAGYSGVEIGYRHIAELDPQKLHQDLRAAGLKLVASHVGGNLEDPSQASGERKVIETVIDFLNRASCNLLMYSGVRWNDAGQFAGDIEMLNRAASRCHESGIRLLYHNHAWEFDNDGRVINGLLASADTLLGLCPDLGWVHKAGADPVAFLDQNASRIGAVHFKDFSTMNNVTDTVILGKGIAPLREAAAWLKAHQPKLPLIAEQDNHDGDPAEAVAANAAFLADAWQSA